MKTLPPLVITVVLAAAVAALWIWQPERYSDATTRAAAQVQKAPQAAHSPSPAPASPDTRALEAKIAALESSIATLTKTVESLQQNFEGVSLEKASAERQALFAAEEGYLKADEYFEAGKFAIAGEGYLTFLTHHPTHPDAREIMKKARDAFLKAGYKDKAFWVQEEMMKAHPQTKFADMAELASLEKEAGMYAKAAGHMAEAAELAPNPEERLWKRLYWAWYVQLAQGPAAGISAMEQVQQEIVSSGVSNPKLGEHASRRLSEWQQQLPGR